MTMSVQSFVNRFLNYVTYVDSAGETARGYLLGLEIGNNRITDISLIDLIGEIVDLRVLNGQMQEPAADEVGLLFDARVGFSPDRESAHETLERVALVIPTDQGLATVFENVSRDASDPFVAIDCIEPEAITDYETLIPNAFGACDVGYYAPLRKLKGPLSHDFLPETLMRRVRYEDEEGEMAEGYVVAVSAGTEGVIYTKDIQSGVRAVASYFCDKGWVSNEERELMTKVRYRLRAPNPVEGASLIVIRQIVPGHLPLSDLLSDDRNFMDLVRLPDDSVGFMDDMAQSASAG